MARGPLPEPNKRRRNAPTIPTTDLPASGRKGRPPKVPEGYNLGKAGRAWWKWAWTTPQAAAWDRGAHYHAARRASLEDDLDRLDNFDEFELGELLGLDDDHKMLRELGVVIGRLKALAGGRVSVMKEMRELDARLGLNPKALADLRWKIVGDEPTQQPRARKASGGARRAHLSAVK